MKLRPPSTPLITHDPYFSIWYDKSPFDNVCHWTGRTNSIRGILTLDAREYMFMGKTRRPDLTLEKTDIDLFSTTLTYICDTIRLTVKFTSPTLITNLKLVSRPVTLCRVSWEALDGKEHEVSVRFACSEELVLNLCGEGRA